MLIKKTVVGLYQGDGAASGIQFVWIRNICGHESFIHETQIVGVDASL